MARLLQISQLGHPILRERAQAVKKIAVPETQALIDDMIATVVDSGGVGIAAPQVYQGLRVFILASHPSARYPDAPTMEPTAIINPKVISHSKEIVKNWEGCLSIQGSHNMPSIRGLVPRYTTIKVEYTNREGKKVTSEFGDFIARIFQHEYDHIEGLVFLDRLESNKDIITDKEYQKLVAQRTSK